MSSSPIRLIAMAFTSSAHSVEAATAAGAPKSSSTTPNSASVVNTPASAFGNLRAVSTEIARSGGATAFHRSDSATLPHIASFISIGCSALPPKRPWRYSSTA